MSDRTDLPPMGEDGLVIDVERDIDPWVLPDDWSGWVFAGALGWKRVTNLGWTEGGQLRAMWFEIPVDNRIAYCVPLAGAVPMVVRDDG